MFKTFAVALIAPMAVLGKGTGDGNSRENAKSYTLIDINNSDTDRRIMTLNLYNRYGSTDELHLDLDYSFAGKLSQQRFGWCFAE